MKKYKQHATSKSGKKTFALNDPSQPLPISVVMPTRNVRQRLEYHLEQNQDWLPRVEEIIIVDSHSIDGSLDYLRKHLNHPKIRFLQHPPGLWESWNYGICQAHNPYTYISTIGDTITLDGLTHLYETIETLQTDVIISPPQFERENDLLKKIERWPIHNLLESLGIQQPTHIPPVKLYPHAIFHLERSLLGSSASNLYRTTTLKKYPFPTDYGPAGDSAWVLTYNYHVSLAFTSRRTSTFLVHGKAHSVKGWAQMRLIAKMLDLAQTTLERSSQDASCTQRLMDLQHQRFHYIRKRNYYRHRLSPLRFQLSPRVSLCRKKIRYIKNRMAQILAMS